MAEQSQTDDDIRSEYDPSIFEQGQRGKYAERFAAGTNIVLLDPDVAAAFQSDEAVNEALRFVKRIIEDANRLTGGAN